MLLLCHVIEPDFPVARRHCGHDGPRHGSFAHRESTRGPNHPHTHALEYVGAPLFDKVRKILTVQHVSKEVLLGHWIQCVQQAFNRWCTIRVRGFVILLQQTFQPPPVPRVDTIARMAGAVVRRRCRWVAARVNMIVSAQGSVKKEKGAPRTLQCASRGPNRFLAHHVSFWGTPALKNPRPATELSSPPCGTTSTRSLVQCAPQDQPSFALLPCCTEKY